MTICYMNFAFIQGYYDSEGNLYYVDRLKELIKYVVILLRFEASL